MAFRPMLAQSINNVPRDIEKYINDPNYWFEQKLDGRRLLIKIEDGNITATNRAGETITADPLLTEAFDHLEGTWYFDGEKMDNKGGDGRFWLFDMPIALDIVSPQTPYEQRREALEAVFATAFGNAEHLRLVEVSRTCEEKRSLLEWCRAQESEGVMVKSLTGRYIPGKRTDSSLKAKFTETVDCVITEVGREGKSSVAVAVYRDGVAIDVGAVKMTEKNLAKAEVGDVIEVKYLYCSNDWRLYQPRFLTFRDDKDPHECTSDQLKFVNKSIRDTREDPNLIGQKG